MSNWTIAEDMLLQFVSELRAELASMRQCFDAADRERSELRERAERAEAERDALRAAWLFCKHNGMEPTAKQLADTVLDVETAMHQVADALTPNAKLDGRG